jgi:hypothetical protein
MQTAESMGIRTSSCSCYQYRQHLNSDHNLPLQHMAPYCRPGGFMCPSGNELRCSISNSEGRTIAKKVTRHLFLSRVQAYVKSNNGGSLLNRWLCLIIQQNVRWGWKYLLCSKSAPLQYYTPVTLCRAGHMAMFIRLQGCVPLCKPLASHQPLRWSNAGTSTTIHCKDVFTVRAILTPSNEMSGTFW